MLESEQYLHCFCNTNAVTFHWTLSMNNAHLHQYNEAIVTDIDQRAAFTKWNNIRSEWTGRGGADHNLELKWWKQSQQISIGWTDTCIVCWAALMAAQCCWKDLHCSTGAIITLIRRWCSRTLRLIYIQTAFGASGQAYTDTRSLRGETTAAVLTYTERLEQRQYLMNDKTQCYHYPTENMRMSFAKV